MILPSRKSSPTFLPSFARLAAVIERIVDKLESDPEIHAVGAAGSEVGLGAPGQHRPDLAGGGEQFGGLAPDDEEIFVFGRLGVLGRGELHDLAFGNDGRGLRQDIERTQIADIDHHPERLAEQEVTDQDAGLVAPEHAGRELPRRISLSSTTSSCSSVAVCMNSTAAASFTWPSPS